MREIIKTIDLEVILERRFEGNSIQSQDHQGEIQGPSKGQQFCLRSIEFNQIQKSKFNPVHVFLHFGTFCLVVLQLILASKLSELKQFEIWHKIANLQANMIFLENDCMLGQNALKPTPLKIQFYFQDNINPTHKHHF